jgi:hypothetical protein
MASFKIDNNQRVSECENNIFLNGNLYNASKIYIDYENDNDDFICDTPSNYKTHSKSSYTHKERTRGIIEVYFEHSEDLKTKNDASNVDNIEGSEQENYASMKDITGFIKYLYTNKMRLEFVSNENHHQTLFVSRGQRHKSFDNFIENRRSNKNTEQKTDTNGPNKNRRARGYSVYDVQIMDTLFHLKGKQGAIPSYEEFINTA